MALPRVRSCCCGCSLRTGTLIILILSLVGGLSYPFKCFSVTGGGTISNIIITIFSIAGFAASGSGIYAVCKEKPQWLVPYMIAQFLVFMSLIIVMLAVAICGVVFLGDLLKITVDDRFAHNVKQSGFSAVISFEVSSAMSLGIIYYSAIVVQSFYKELRSEYHEI
ncbi:uncharacterized protein LOC135846680 [Planococcus citri]|uniref:uncharacterized protein LOC135846680 n=1 Tax=Planococcus citri TaxID=170843 RepID=UPI0031F91AD1